MFGKEAFDALETLVGAFVVHGQLGDLFAAQGALRLLKLHEMGGDATAKGVAALGLNKRRIGQTDAAGVLGGTPFFFLCV